MSEGGERPDTLIEHLDTVRSRAIFAENEELASLFVALGEEKARVARELDALKEQCARDSRLRSCRIRAAAPRWATRWAAWQRPTPSRPARR